MDWAEATSDSLLDESPLTVFGTLKRDIRLQLPFVSETHQVKMRSHEGAGRLRIEFANVLRFAFAIHATFGFHFDAFRVSPRKLFPIVGFELAAKLRSHLRGSVQRVQKPVQICRSNGPKSCLESGFRRGKAHISPTDGGKIPVSHEGFSRLGRDISNR